MRKVDIMVSNIISAKSEAHVIQKGQLQSDWTIFNARSKAHIL